MIKILLFAGLQEALQEHEVVLNESSITVDELKDKLKEKYPKLPNINQVMIAINEEYVMDPKTMVKSGDTIALIPPVSGG